MNYCLHTTVYTTEYYCTVYTTYYCIHCTTVSFRTVLSGYVLYTCCTDTVPSLYTVPYCNSVYAVRIPPLYCIRCVQYTVYYVYTVYAVFHVTVCLPLYLYPVYLNMYRMYCTVILWLLTVFCTVTYCILCTVFTVLYCSVHIVLSRSSVSIHCIRGAAPASLSLVIDESGGQRRSCDARPGSGPLRLPGARSAGPRAKISSSRRWLRAPGSCGAHHMRRIQDAR